MSSTAAPASTPPGFLLIDRHIEKNAGSTFRELLWKVRELLVALHGVSRPSRGTLEADGGVSHHRTGRIQRPLPLLGLPAALRSVARLRGHDVQPERHFRAAAHLHGGAHRDRREGVVARAYATDTGAPCHAHVARRPGPCTAVSHRAPAVSNRGPTPGREVQAGFAAGRRRTGRAAFLRSTARAPLARIEGREPRTRGALQARPVA
eukprot:2141112-Prymnesium_polylepis.1